jgi:hypothetical protein
MFFQYNPKRKILKALYGHSSLHHQPSRAQPSINLRKEVGDHTGAEVEAEVAVRDLRIKWAEKIFLSLSRKRLRPWHQLLPSEEKKS